MKKSTTKMVAFGILILMLLSIFTVPVKAATYEKVVLEKADGSFLIYYKDICNEEFEFAFSSNKDEKEENLSFTKSALDQSTANALNIAYVDSALYDAYFKSNNDQAYIWIMDSDDNIVVSADLVDLKDSLDDEKIDLVNTMTIVNEPTDRVEVDTTQTHQKQEMIDGVDTTITTGKVVINEKEEATYSYLLIPVSEEATDANELFDLAEALGKDISDTYENLSLTKQFYDLYIKLMPTKATEWTEVENAEILQPEDTENGDKYILYIKEDIENGDSIVDAKFLTCVYEAEQGVDQTEETITETVKLPVTFDSGSILFIILGIIILALVVFAVIRIKANKKDESK